MCTIDTRDRVSIDTGDRHLDRPAIDTRSTSRSTDFQFSLTLYGVAIDTSDDHTYWMSVDVSIATLRSAVGRMSVVCQ